MCSPFNSKAFFDNITDAEGKISPDLKLEVDNCDDPYCRVRGDRPTCSNTYFENLPAGYEVLTEVGFYQSPNNKSYVDATNLKSVADIVEMRCSATTGTEQVHHIKQDLRNCTVPYPLSHDIL